MDHEAIDGAMGCASYLLGSNRTSDGSEGAMDVASDRSGSNRRSYGWYKRCIREQ
jgi:hypothetical protein